MKRVKKTRGITEIKIKLLPDKGKRDYLLRLVSTVIVMFFIVLNFLIVYIPLTNYNSQLTDLKSKNASKELAVLDLNNKYDFFYEDVYHKNDVVIKDIIRDQMDFNQIMLMFSDTATYVEIHDNLSENDKLNPNNIIPIKPNHSFIESIQYSESSFSFVIAVQFDTYNDLSSYEDQLNRIKYVTKVEVGNRTNVPMEDSSSRWKTTFKITIDPTSIYCPKVGDLDE